MLNSLSRRTLVRLVLWKMGMYSPDTQTTLAERSCLARHAATKRRLVEIGVFNGVTTLELRQAMAHDAVLWAVDPFPSGKLRFNVDERIAKSNVQKSGNGCVRFVKSTGSDAAVQYAAEGCPPVDFIFIDGDHSWQGIESDWKGWHPLIGVGGIAALHDSRSYGERNVTLDSARFTAEVIRRNQSFEVVDEVDSVTVMRKVCN